MNVGVGRVPARTVLPAHSQCVHAVSAPSSPQLTPLTARALSGVTDSCMSQGFTTPSFTLWSPLHVIQQHKTWQLVGTSCEVDFYSLTGVRLSPQRPPKS